MYRSTIFLFAVLSWHNVSAATALSCTKPADAARYKTCESQAFQAADDDLNRTYRAVMSVLAGSQSGKYETLRDAQRSWIKFRDKHCAFDSMGFEEDRQNVLLSNCKEELSEHRTAYLRRVLRELQTAPRQADTLPTPPTEPARDEPAPEQHAEYETPAWYGVLGSFPLTPAGREAADKVAATVQRVTGDDSIFITESDYYQGLNPGVYVVLKGPFVERGAAYAWIAQPVVRGEVADGYVKQVRERIVE